MAPYTPPTGSRTEKLRLDFNENTVGCSPRVIEALKACLSVGQLSMYPEYHAAMLERYRAQDWTEAEAALCNCRGRDPRLEPLYDLYAERLAYFAANPPAPDWDGVFVALTK